MAAELSGEPEPQSTALIDESALLAMSNAELDVLFRASPPGAIPDGNMRGTVLIFPGTVLAKPIAVGAYAVAWQGKVVNGRQRMLRNKITPLRLRLIAARLAHEPSWVDGEQCVVLDYSRTSFVARMVRDEIRLVAPGLYLGVVWTWHKRVAWFTLRGNPGRS
ncbi:hypothetical protein ACPPVT_16130 [Angustibacter sp. McL0619]|uniref:hypothetical protein n=1 Tax=Angustibacter sp. McL0619 TaxID=3415676 RepID=UPI003CEA07BE